MGICIKSDFGNLALDTFPISQVDLQKFSLYDHQHLPVIFILAQHKTDTNLSALYKSKYLKIRSRYENHEALFTDGSKDDESACTAVYSNAVTKS